jgi:hypothetical protein
MIAAEFDRSGEEERDHQLEPSGKRTRQDQSQGETHPQPTQLPADSTGKAVKTALAQAELLRASGREANF